MSCTNTSNCTCSSCLTVSTCTTSVGCTSTNYAKCIYFSGTSITSGVTITNGDNLDTVIASLATAIAGLTPSDLSWGSFDYDCLTTYTSAQEFAEGIASEICALKSTGALLPSTVTVPATASPEVEGLVAGTSTTVEVFDAVFSDLAYHENFNTSGTVTTTCSAGTWSTLPTSPVLKDWINWIKNNVCTLVSAVKTRATDLETFQSDVETFVGTLDAFDNTDCLSGGGSDDLQTTIGLIKSKLCSVDTTVAALPNLAALSLPWATCGGTIGGSWAGYANSASLSTQLSRIVTQLAARTYTFSSDFSVSSGSCGQVVSLATAPSVFTCSSLNTCSIHNLQDVNATTLGTSSGDKFKVLSWSTVDSEWFPKPLSVTSSGGTVAVTSTDDGSSIVFNLSVGLTDGGNSDDTSMTDPIDLVIGSASGGSRALSLKYNSNFFANSTALTFTPAANTAASAYVTDSTVPYKKAGVVHLGGAYTYTALGSISAGAFNTLGTISSLGVPTVSNKVFQSVAVDEATDTSYNILLQIDVAGGTIQFKNTSGGTLAAADYTICLSGISYII